MRPSPTPRGARRRSRRPLRRDERAEPAGFDRALAAVAVADQRRGERARRRGAEAGARLRERRASAVALEAPHALTSAAKDGSRARVRARSLSTARTPTAPTACSKSATASEDALETGSADAGSAEDASPPALVSPTDAEDAASAVGGSARDGRFLRGVSSDALARALIFLLRGSPRRGRAVAFLASSASSRSSAALAASSSAAADATTAPLPLSPSSAPLNPSAASKRRARARSRETPSRRERVPPRRRRHDTLVRLHQPDDRVERLGRVVEILRAPRARVRRHLPQAVRGSLASAFVMTLARASSPPSSPSGSPPLEHHSPRAAPARAASRAGPPRRLRTRGGDGGPRGGVVHLLPRRAGGRHGGSCSGRALGLYVRDAHVLHHGRRVHGRVLLLFLLGRPRVLALCVGVGGRHLDASPPFLLRALGEGAVQSRHRRRLELFERHGVRRLHLSCRGRVGVRRESRSRARDGSDVGKEKRARARGVSGARRRGRSFFEEARCRIRHERARNSSRIARESERGRRRCRRCRRDDAVVAPRTSNGTPARRIRGGSSCSETFSPCVSASGPRSLPA